jgi:transposase
MQGKQVLKESLFVYNLSIEIFVPENHILRKVNQIIDLSFICELTQDKYGSNNGRTSIDPELFFRLMIIKYIYGIESERRLCEDAHSHMGYRWFCRLSMEDAVPHHSSLTKIRDRLGEDTIEQFFDCIVQQCCQHGLVKGKRMITDGTLIKANASINSLEAINMIERHQEDVREKSDRNEPNQKRIQRKLSNKTHLSRTDPESTLAYKNGCSNGLKYKGH